MPKTRGTGILGPPVAPTIVNMSGITKPAKLKLLIYGAPGVGKTWLAGSAPKPLLFDFDGGAASLAGRDVDVVERPTTSEFQGHVNWLLTEAPDRYQTIILDTLTAAQKLTTAELMGTSDRMTQQLWGDTLTIWRKLLMSLENLPCNLIVLCHEREENVGTEEHAVKRYSYALQGSIASDIHAMFDSIGRMTKHVVRQKADGTGKMVPCEPVEVRRVRFFAPDESFMCKDRLSIFGQQQLKADVNLLARLAAEAHGEEKTEAPAPPPTPPPTAPEAAPAAPAPKPTPPKPPAAPKPPPEPPAAPAPPAQPTLPSTPAPAAATPATPAGPPRRKRAPAAPKAPAPAPAAEEPLESEDPSPPDADAPPEEDDEPMPWDDATAGGDDQ
jgi:phage nucleotide-binding protein